MWQRSLRGEKLELQLYCQAPGCWHPTREGGHYVFDYPPHWLRVTGGYLTKMVTLLKHVAPLAGPWVGWAAADYARLIADDVRLMAELVALLPEIAETDEMEMADWLAVGRDDAPDGRAEGAALRAIRQLLDELDEPQTWGGLKRVLTPEDHYLWLCEYHAQPYRL
jgi:hypothetical protein